MAFAFLFPGQGEQKPGMMADLGTLPVVKETFAEASEALHSDLWALITGEDAEALNQTEVTQPLMLTVGTATFRAYRHLGGSDPAYLAGHSLGEYTALAAAEALSFSDAVKLVRHRGELMQEAVPAGTGAMAAILGLNADEVAEVCSDIRKTGGKVDPANFNSLNQTVIAGTAEAVAAAQKLAEERGAKKTVLLPVSVPSHCGLMQPAAEKLAELLDQVTVNQPKIAVINNVDVKVESEPSAIKDALVRQLYSPVHWTEIIQDLIKKEITVAAECAPTRVLTDLARRISKELVSTPFMTVEAIEEWISTNSQGEKA